VIKSKLKLMIAFWVSVFSLSAVAEVTVIINKQAFEFENPVRLNKILEPVAQGGDWYWPVSAIYDLTRTDAEREKASVLSEIRRLLNLYRDDKDMQQALTGFYEQVGSWTVATRILAPVSYNRARLFPQHNPMFQEGKYLIRISPRPDINHVLGAVKEPGAYKLRGNTAIYTTANSIALLAEADNSYVTVITPMGQLETHGAAYWNVDFAQIVPGSQIYVPISPRFFDSRLAQLNERIAKLAVHRILPQ